MSEHVTIPIASLREQETNPNTMTDEEFVQLRESIRTLGFHQSILVVPIDDGSVYKIIDGHHRTRAMRDLGASEIDARIFDNDEDAEAAKALQLALNRNRGSTNLTVAEQYVRDLSAAGWEAHELVACGFNDDELAQLLADAPPEDDAPPPPASVPSLEDLPAAKPFVLEIAFTDRDAYQLAKRKLRKAGGDSKDLGLGLLAVLGEA